MNTMLFRWILNLTKIISMLIRFMFNELFCALTMTKPNADLLAYSEIILIVIYEQLNRLAVIIIFTLPFSRSEQIQQCLRWWNWNCGFIRLKIYRKNIQTLNVIHKAPQQIDRCELIEWVDLFAFIVTMVILHAMPTFFSFQHAIFRFGRLCRCRSRALRIQRVQWRRRWSNNTHRKIKPELMFAFI